MRTVVDKAGTQIAVHRYAGTGPDLILIHGIGSSSADFNPIVSGLTDICNPVSIDLRGHGISDKPTAGYHYRDYVRDLATVISNLHMDRPIILGHSLGGIVAMYWAAQHPEAAKALIIEDSPLRSGEDFRSAFEGWLALNALPEAAVRAWYASNNPNWPDTVIAQRAFDMVNTSRAAISELMEASMASEGLDTSVDLEYISVPVLFMHGEVEAGSMFHPQDKATLQSRVPNVQMVTVPGAGHTIHRSHPTEWLAHVRKFISGQKN